MGILKNNIMPCPNKAFDNDGLNLNWLKNATEQEQEKALFNWFTSKYEDPAKSLPYSSEDGGYQFIYGGAIDPKETLSEFSDIVSDSVIQNVSKLLYNICFEWSPIQKF